MSFETGGYVHYLFKFTDKRILMVSSPFHEFIIVWEIKRVKKQSNMRFASVLISNGRELKGVVPSELMTVKSRHLMTLVSLFLLKLALLWQKLNNNQR